jgi:transcription elongation factor GreB
MEHKSMSSSENDPEEDELEDLPADQEDSKAKTTKTSYMTPDGHKALKDEYLKLYRDERPKLVEVIAWAASNGDRSENADYIYGKRRLREIDKRLYFLTKRLESAVVVDPKQQTGKQIVFGATVELEDEDGKRFTYQIVGEDEANPTIGKINWLSPLAKALLGHTEGEEVIVNRPSGETTFVVLAVRFT